MNIIISLAFLFFAASAIAQTLEGASKLSLTWNYDDGEEVVLVASVKMFEPDIVLFTAKAKRIFGGYRDTEKTPFLNELSLQFAKEKIDVPKRALEILAHPDITSLRLVKDEALYHVNIHGSDGEKGYTASLTYDRKIGRWLDMEVKTIYPWDKKPISVSLY